jgi:hypothetical protein
MLDKDGDLWFGEEPTVDNQNYFLEEKKKFLENN